LITDQSELTYTRNQSKNPAHDTQPKPNTTNEKQHNYGTNFSAHC
jgi:hypothetical protein